MRLSIWTFLVVLYGLDFAVSYYQVPVCAHGWLYLAETDSCYKYFAQNVNYQTAKYRCQVLQSTLAMPKTERQNKFITSTIGQKVVSIWYGLDDLCQEGTFKWLDGELVTGWTRWYTDEPNNWEGIEHCVHSRYGDNRWNDIACHSTYPFVCQMKRNGCQPGWLYFPETDSCYKHFAHIVNYHTAVYKCKAFKSLLAMPKTKTQNNIITSTMGNNVVSVWYGLTDLLQEGTFIFQDGEPLKAWNNWAYGEPNNSGNEHCVHSRSGDNRWNDIACRNAYSFVCQGRRTGCPHGWLRFAETDSCYKHFAQDVNYHTAVHRCHALNSVLAMPKTQTQYNFIISTLGTNVVGIWAGLDDIQQEGTFKFLDGERLNGYSRWNYGEPNNYGGYEDCVHFRKGDNLWNDINCNSLYQYVCQMKRIVFHGH